MASMEKYFDFTHYRYPSIHDNTEGGVLFKPYMNYVQSYLERELQAGDRLEIISMNEVEGEKGYEWFNMKCMHYEEKKPYKTFDITSWKSTRNQIEKESDCLKKFLAHLPQEMNIVNFLHPFSKDRVTPNEYEMFKAKNMTLASVAPISGIWKTVGRMLEDLSDRCEERQKHMSKEGQERDLAMAMMTHPRLGAASPGTVLSYNILEQIASRTVWDDRLLDCLTIQKG
jgi:hypothetical protein